MATLAARVMPLPVYGGGWRVVERNYLVYKRAWVVFLTGFLEPVLYLFSIGVGVANLVNKFELPDGTMIGYTEFVAPALLASAAMQGALFDSTFNIFFRMKYAKLYDAILATPLRPADLFHGHLLWTTLRLTMTSAIFLVVMAVFGAAGSPWVIVCLPAAVLTGLAFAAPIEAYAMTCTKDTSFAMLFRFGIIPLFLFSGTFFPITQLPVYVRPLAYATPLWHGVALCRSLSLGTAQLGASAGHVGYLAAVTALGIYAGNRTYRRRLYA